ncbi:tautomerase family protein [Aquabacterium lacunae]|uniref:Tautomerase family protein n=1 Tax=Aquabacterium lacunae TaxID=2528630 RepID=A0A4Q9H099_9BURK|nr:tautomerase family protein [Aquabacterium lacunae]TBO32562.1 tautomerase family protein [Aquabacterium lacunae]
MPTVTIEVKHNYTTEQEIAIIDAVHQAMMEGIKTPEWDKNIRLVVHEPHRFTSPPGKSDRYTLVTFDMFSGRSIEAKRALYSAIVRNLSALGIQASDVIINLREHPPENWGVQGGKPASDVDLGFNINV